ncbi:MAG TPA: SUMF1/EgtB/PvdO family nonheme iron enzyme [Turneriella sp.]|nr:SUMF1/EgtB/PvdO family nonheme iron enzyme [Turneriella sp.]
MLKYTLRTLSVIGALVFAIHCSSAKAKTTNESYAENFSFTKNDTNNCGTGAKICLTSKVISRELVDAVSNNVLLDSRAVTAVEYQDCVDAKQCESKGRAKDASQPMTNLSFEHANRYCAWAGGRLPTIAELKAGMQNENFVKSDASEWSNDWAPVTGDKCIVNKKNICEPRNPMGIASGIYPYPTLKLKQTLNTSTGTVASVETTSTKNHIFRCASDSQPPTKAPPWMEANPPVALGDPDAPSSSELKKLHNLEATDTLNKPICKEKYTSPAHCKDPMTYFTPNESQNYVFAPYIRNLGGGYAGVAADANYSYIALAKSRFVWLFDFDVNINALHRIIRAFILESENVPIFLTRFEKKNKEASLAIIKKYYADRDDVDFIQQVFRNNHEALGKHYKKNATPDKRHPDFGWLAVAENYRYIRLLYTQDRIAIVPGDMLKDKTMQSIGKAAKSIGIPIRVYYPSNAEEFWDYSTSNSNYKRNILSLPFDEASITFRTVHEYPWHPKWRKGMQGFWHYVVHGAYNYQKKLMLPHFDYMDYFKMFRVVSSTRADFSTIEIPAKLPKNILEQGNP